MRLLHAGVLAVFAVANMPLQAQTVAGSGAALAQSGRLSVQPRPQPHSGPNSEAGTITGQVTGAQGEPLSAAGVVVVGTSLRATTAADGRYTIAGVPAGTHQVRASLIGFAEQTVAGVRVADGATATVDFRLEPQAIRLEEIVAVGYGTQQRKDLTGAVAAVDGSAIKSLPVTGAD